MMPRSPELQAAVSDAERRAGARAQAATTLDLLAALLERDLVRKVMPGVSLRAAAARPNEPPEKLERALADAERLAARCASESVCALHALAVLCRDAHSAAYGALFAGGHDPTRIRAAALRELTAPRRERRVRGHAGASVSANASPLSEVSDRADPRTRTPAQSPAIAPVAAPMRDLVAAARAGELEPLLGRERELSLLCDVLARRRGALACVVGEPGTGKTALVHGLARLLARSPAAVPALSGRALLAVEPQVTPGQLTNDRPVVLFYDGAPEPAVMTALVQANSSAIVALTPTDLRRLQDSAPALSGRTSQVLLAEPPASDTLAIVRALAPGYARHHRVTYDVASLEAAVRLAPRYPSERFLPDKALVLVDLSGARTRRTGRTRVGEDDVAGLVAESAGIPVERLLVRDAERLLAMERHLGERVVGHADALARIAAVVRRNYAGFRASRPVGSFLFLGPTGVGKTETAKALAEFLYGDAQSITRLDMSEYMESHSVARLIGSPPGYIGYEEGGQLTEAVRRRPDTVVLLDEIEKAHKDVLPILLQILDEGRLTDGRGRTIDFTNTIIIMTSNLGVGCRRAADVRAAARRAFPVELWNRIEEPLVFTMLGPVEVAEVARRLARASSSRLERERGIRFELDEAAIAYLARRGGDASLGARPMRAALGRLVEAPLAEAILSGEVGPGEAVRVAYRGRRLAFSKL